MGMTRAKDHLELSYYISPDQPGVRPGPGRYLAAIPERLVQKEEGREQKVSLQQLKRQVQENIEKKKKEEIPPEQEADNPAPDTAGRRITHKKYGEGTVVREDDTAITINFDDYGEKEFLKMFLDI